MKTGKAPDPSDTVVEMIWAAGDIGASMIHDLTAAIIGDGKVHSNWEQRFIVCLYKSKGDALERGNNCGLKLIGQVMKVLERIVDSLIRVDVNQWFPVWPHPRLRHKRCNLCCQAAAREVSSCQQEPLHGFCRPGEGIWSSALEGHLVGAEKTWCEGVDCVTGAGDVCQCVEPCLCWWGVQWWVWSEGWCSPRLSTQPTALHHCANEALWCEVCCGIPWEDLYADDLVIIAKSLEECVRRLDLERSNEGERQNARKMKIMICGVSLDLLQSSGEFPCPICHTGVGSTSIFCKRCKHRVLKEMKWAQVLDKGPRLQMYKVAGNCTPLGQQTTEGSPSQTWQAGGGSFLLLPRKHALKSWWLWTFNHNTCENHLDEVQGAATSSLFLPPLFQDTWPPVQLLCVELNAPCQWDLAIDKAKPPSSAAETQGNDQTDLQCQAARHSHHQVQWADWVAWHWGSRPHSEGEKAPLVWTCGMLQWCSEDSLWHTGWWKACAWEAQDDMETADREGLVRVEALGYWSSWMTYLEIWRLCSKPTTWKGAHWCGCCPCTCMLIKNMMMMMSIIAICFSI